MPYCTGSRVVSSMAQEINWMALSRQLTLVRSGSDGADRAGSTSCLADPRLSDREPIDDL